MVPPAKFSGVFPWAKTGLRAAAGFDGVFMALPGLPAPLGLPAEEAAPGHRDALSRSAAR